MLKRMTTYSLKGGDIEKDWHVVDADGQTLGRLASGVATVLRGKHKPTFSPHLDMGDNVVVVNAEKIKVTGNKMADKIYYRHSGYMGGLKQQTLKELMTKNPSRVIELAVRGMLPKNRLGRQILRHLKVYAGPNHPHVAQVNATLKKSAEGEVTAAAQTESK